MRVHYLQHVAFEGLAVMESALKEVGHQLTSTHLYNNQQLPVVNDIDWLIIMGGPMGICDENNYPWLKEEKQFVKEMINAEKIVLGICLGAQLIADALGAKVYKNKTEEIGWFNITRSAQINGTILSDIIPEDLQVFQWHGDTFDLPDNANLIAESEACKNQGFIYDDRVVALQFHLETTLKSATSLIENCRGEYGGSWDKQRESHMLSNSQRFINSNQVMFSMLKALANKHNMNGRLL